MPTATKTKQPPILLGVILKVPIRRFKDKLEEILSRDELRKVKVTQSDRIFKGPNNYLVTGPHTIFEKMSGAEAEYTFENEYVPKKFPVLSLTLTEIMNGPPKILNRGKRVNREFYHGGKNFY